MTLTALSASSATTAGSTAPVSSTSSSAPTAPVDAVAPTGDSGKSHGHHAHGGHGHVRQALMQALDGMGLDGVQGNDGHGAGNLKHDIAQFMHTLFQAVKDEASSSTSATTGGPRAGFGAGLSALITDASQGKAPAALQSAFDRLAADLKLGSATPAAATSGMVSASVPAASDPISTSSTADDGVSTATTTTATTTATSEPDVDAPAASTTATASATTPVTASPAPTSGLQTLLSRLQQLLGYGAATTASSPTTLGNTVNLTA